MSRSARRFSIVLAIAVMAAAATTTTVYAFGKAGSGDGVTTGGVAAAAPASSIGITDCKTGKTDVVVNDVTGGLATTSTSFVAIPGMAASVKTAKGCLIATVSASSLAAGTGVTELVTVTVDGNTGSPGFQQFASQDVALATAHSAQFTFVVSKGTHLVSMQFRSLNGASVVLDRPSMVITHS